MCPSFIAQLVKPGPFFAGADYVTLEWSSKSVAKPEPGQHVLSVGAKFGHQECGKSAILGVKFSKFPGVFSPESSGGSKGGRGWGPGVCHPPPPTLLFYYYFFLPNQSLRANNLKILNALKFVSNRLKTTIVETQIFKYFWRSMPPDTPRKLGHAYVPPPPPTTTPS